MFESLESKIVRSAGTAKSVVERATFGDETAVAELREVLDNIVEALGNLSRRIEMRLVDSISQTDLALREGLTRKLANMRNELSGPSATPLEKHLIERVVLCWLTTHEAEHHLSMSQNLPPRHSEIWAKRVDQAHKRHLTAVKMLATVRKLAVPSLIGQVNFISQNLTQCSQRS